MPVKEPEVLLAEEFALLLAEQELALTEGSARHIRSPPSSGGSPASRGRRRAAIFTFELIGASGKDKLARSHLNIAVMWCDLSLFCRRG
jgi:hypothetical protein